jgi:hypothetical protein
MPKYWSFGTASDAAVNSLNEVHIFSRGEHPVTIWDSDGNFLSSWGEGKFSGNEHGIFIAPNDNVWLVDAWYHIATEHAPDGTVLRTLGRKLEPSTRIGGRPFNQPTGLAIAPNGDLFVSDGYGGHRVHRFSADGELLKSWGVPGAGPGEFALLHNIGVDKNGRVLICDRENNRIQIFDAEGAFLEQWTDLNMPGDLWIEDEVVYVGEQGRGGAVSIWTLGGELITRWRGAEGPGKGTLAGVHGLCVDSQGSIYVAELSEGVGKFQRV